MFQEDWLLRQIQQLAQAVADALGIAREDSRAALEQLQGVRDQLGLPDAMLDGLDPASLRTVLGPEKVGVFVQLLLAEAEAHDQLGDAAMAAEKRARAQALSQPGANTKG